MRFHDEVENIPTFASAIQKSATLHQTEMFRHHGTGQFARFRQLTDGVFALGKNLQNSKAMRMSNRPQAFGSFGQRIKIRQTKARLRHRTDPSCNGKTGQRWDAVRYKVGRAVRDAYGN